MGIKTVAAITAALLAGVLMTQSLAADSRPIDSEADRSRGDARSHEIQARFNVRGQAWATELFGRRYNRHLLAAVAPQGRRDEIEA